MYNFNFNESDLLSKSQNENILDEQEEFKDEEDFDYEDFVQQAIASGDIDTLVLINEIEVEEGKDEEENHEVIEDDESFSIVEKDGQKWKVLSTAKGKYNAARKYNECITKTKNEVRLISLKDLEKMDESRKNEAPANSESLFTALMSELNTIYKCEITDEGFLRCTDDGGNFIEIATVKNTDPVELGMRVTFTDGTQSETVYYIYDNIQAVNDFIQAVFISEVNAFNDINEVEAEEVQKEEKEDIELEDENQAQEEIDKNVEEVEEESEEKTESLKRKSLNEDWHWEENADNYVNDIVDRVKQQGYKDVEVSYEITDEDGEVVKDFEYRRDAIDYLDNLTKQYSDKDFTLSAEIITRDEYDIEESWDSVVIVSYRRQNESLKRKSLNEDVIPAVYDSLIIRYKDKHDRNDFDEIVKILKDLRKTATFITDNDIREDLEGWRFPEEDVDEIINAIKADKNESKSKNDCKFEFTELVKNYSKFGPKYKYIEYQDLCTECPSFTELNEYEACDLIKSLGFEVAEPNELCEEAVFALNKDMRFDDLCDAVQEWIDSLNESLNRSESKVTPEKIKKEVENKIKYIYRNEPEILEYVNVDSYYSDEDGRLVIEVRAELSYDGMVRLAEELDSIIQKYDKYAYFDQVDGGIMNAILDFDEKYESLNESDDTFNYMMLDRLRMDCDYFLGEDDGYEPHLWAKNVEDQIAEMRKIYDKLPEKPEWLSLEDIDNYEKEMLAKRDSKNEVKEITRDEWNKTPKDYKMIKDGKPYLVYLDDETHATVLGPCKIIDESLDGGIVTVVDIPLVTEKLYNKLVGMLYGNKQGENRDYEQQQNVLNFLQEIEDRIAIEAGVSIDLEDYGFTADEINAIKKIVREERVDESLNEEFVLGNRISFKGERYEMEIFYKKGKITTCNINDNFKYGSTINEPIVDKKDLSDTHETRQGLETYEDYLIRLANYYDIKLDINELKSLINTTKDESLNEDKKVWYELYLPSEEATDEDRFKDKEFYEEYPTLIEARKAAKDAMKEFGYEKFYLYKMSPDWDKEQYCDTLTLEMFDESLNEDGTVSDMGVAPIMPASYDDIDDIDDELFDITEGFLFPDSEEETDEDKEEEVNSLMGAAIEDINQGQPTASEWIEDAQYVFNSIKDDTVKNRLRNKYSQYLESKKNESSDNELGLYIINTRRMYDKYCSPAMDKIRQGKEDEVDWFKIAIEGAKMYAREIEPLHLNQEDYRRTADYIRDYYINLAGDPQDESFQKNEASAELNKVLKDLAANDKTDVDKEINKLYKEEPDAKSNVADGSPILGATSPDNIVPTIDKAIMNKAIFAATSYANNGPQMFAKLQESFKNIDRKTIDDLMNSKDVAGIAKYLYESEMRDNNLNLNVKNWYIKEFPEDELGEEIPTDLTFEDVNNNIPNVYDLLEPADDSIVRERVFTKLAELKDVDYDTVYNDWLNESLNEDKFKIGDRVLVPGNKDFRRTATIIKKIGKSDVYEVEEDEVPSRGWPARTDRYYASELDLLDNNIDESLNEDTFTDPQMNVVNSNSTTVATGNSSETPKLADDIDPAPTEVQGFPKDKSEIENTNANNKDDQLAKDSGTKDIPTT